MITAIDLFCGVGGWSTGAARCGVNVQYALNHNEEAIAAHKVMHPNTKHFCQDVAQFPFEALDPVDLMLASPSCRDFTPAGKPARAGTGGNGTVDLEKLVLMRNAERNTAWATIAAMTALKPRVVLVENVPEMYGWDGYTAWNAAFIALGYSVKPYILNAADYGAAVDRPRAIIIGVRDFGETRLAIEWGDSRMTMGECLDSYADQKRWWKPIDSKPAATRDLIRRKQRESRMRFGILNNVGDGVRMRGFDELAPSLTTQSGTQLMHVADDMVRILNPLELTRMMGWQDSEIAHALPTQRKLCSRLIGNAISPALAEGLVSQAKGWLSP